MKNRIYESMTRVQHYGLTIRVWKTEEEFTFESHDEKITDAIKRLVLSRFAAHPLWVLAKSISETLDAFTDVSAYEILDANGNGCVVYPDWK